MAIDNTSSFNTLIARSLTQSNGTDDALQSLSGGTLPQESVEKINQVVNNGIKDVVGTPTRQNVATEVYDEVASIMAPSVPGMTEQTLSSVLQSNNIMGKIGGGLPSTNIENQLSNLQNKFDKKLLQITGGIDQELNQFGFPGFAQNAANAVSDQVSDIVNDAMLSAGLDVNGIVPSIDQGVSKNIATILGGEGTIDASTLTSLADSPIQNFTDADGNIDLASLSDAQKNDLAAEVLSEATGLDKSDSLGIVEQTSGTINGLTEVQELDLIGPASYEIGGDNVGAGSTYVSSVEELEAEMSSMTRDISEIIVHWSETFTNANLTAAELTTLTGAGDNAYHLIIRRDGSVERGVPMNSVGSHCPINGHNSYSIGVCLVGGVNVSSDTRSLVGETTPRSITRSQYNSLYQIFRTFFNQYPGGQALGHMDVDPTQNDPGFDVRDYVYNNFNKTSLYKDPPNDPALSPQDILKALEGQGLDILTKDPDVLEKKF